MNFPSSYLPTARKVLDHISLLRSTTHDAALTLRGCTLRGRGDTGALFQNADSEAPDHEPGSREARARTGGGPDRLRDGVRGAGGERVQYDEDPEAMDRGGCNEPDG